MSSNDNPQKLVALVRSLNLIPYFHNHPNATILEAAADLGMEPLELKQALHRLWFSGTGKAGGQLLDMFVDYGNVTIIDDQGLTEPLRLTPTEAGALLLTLESLETMPGLIDAQAVKSAAGKIRAVMDKETTAIYDSLAEPDEEESHIQLLLSQALAESRKVELHYWSASSARETTRIVDPARIFLFDSEAYLAAWEDEVGAHRTFRLDRIRAAKLLDQPAEPHLAQLDFNPKDPFGFSQRSMAHIEVHQEFTWLADSYDIRLADDAKDNWIPAQMPIGSAEWFVRFALSHADGIRVLAPKNLVDTIAQKATAALGRYTQ